MGTIQMIAAAFLLPFKAIYAFSAFLFKKETLIKKDGAAFSTPSETSSFLSARNKGLLLDGESLRLDLPSSFQNVCVMARVGAGKTSRYIIPNVLAQAHEKSSLVVNDPKGEVWAATGGYMASCGYRVIRIDPENLAQSNRFNPLLEAKTDIELEQIAEILVRAGTSSQGKDEFWTHGAIRFASLFLKVIANAGRDDPKILTLHNLAYLFQHFGSDGRALDDFMSVHTIYKDDPHDRRLWNEWRGLLTGNEEGIQSFVMNVLVSLRALSNPNIARLTAESDFSLEEIRRKKTVIYFITPPQHAEYYGFLTSIFFRSVFNAAMRRAPTKETLPLYILYDEFGHSTIPQFVSTANTIRGYGVSLSIVLQSISQLRARYGESYAYSIQGGFGTYLTYSGADPETASFFERVIGNVRERQKRDLLQVDDQYREYSLISSAEIRMLASHEALIVSGNKKPAKLRTKAHFEQRRLKSMTSYAPQIPPSRPVPKLHEVNLDVFGDKSR